mmetsp:Transcript_3815/g.12158  ORF Transcript_3815/g.12158 Transcript_3815/m.12158 type:complete len:377 (+) Transcript_3815:102-1232(+)
MSGRRAILQHLQVLQSPRPLDVPPACLGNAGLAPPELSGASEAFPDAAQLQGKVRTAEFWISLLEGERCDLVEEVSKHKQRHQLALRQTEAKASALREAEGERKRLQAELRWLQQSRDEAICDRHLLKEDNERNATRSQQDTGQLAARAEALEAELRREREEKANLEAQLVRTKVRYAETLQRADSLQYLIDYYEDQLRALNPDFEPTDLATVGHLLRPSPTLDASELESDASGAIDQPSTISEEKHRSSGRRSLKVGISKVKQIFNRRESRDASDQPVTPRECPSFGSATPRVASREHSVGGFTTPRPSGTEPSTGEPGGTAAGPAVARAAAPGEPEAGGGAGDGSAGPQAGAATQEPATPRGPARPKRWELRKE